MRPLIYYVSLIGHLFRLELVLVTIQTASIESHLSMMQLLPPKIHSEPAVESSPLQSVELLQSFVANVRLLRWPVAVVVVCGAT